MPVSESIAETFQIAAGCWRGSRISRDFHDIFPEAGACALLLGRSAPATKPLDVVRHVLHSSGWNQSPAHHEAATARMNRILCRTLHGPREATVFWSYFDAPNQLLRYVNAGHVPPFLFKADRRNMLLRLRTGGPGLGLLPHFSFQQGAVRMDPGDVLVLYSEGVLNATNHRQERFGEERLRLVISSCLDRPADEIRKRIISAVGNFTEENDNSEDRTIIVARFRGVQSHDCEEAVDRVTLTAV
jgi:phosphoserine phosphatase RsbU/P